MRVRVTRPLFRPMLTFCALPNPGWDEEGGRGGGGLGGGNSTKFFQPLPFNIPFLTEKVSLSYTFHRKIENGTPFTHLQ